jgi:hypothetical protein
MDMHSREQYLASLREEYRRATRKQKTRLLNEARRRTRLNRKVLIRKLAHPAVPPGARSRRRGKTYGAEVKEPLARLWAMFDYPCSKRLVAVLREQVEPLRGLGELRCSDSVAELLQRLSARTADRLLDHERQVQQVRRNRRAPVHPLLYQRVPVKLPSEWDRQQVGHLQLDFVLHSGRSGAGEFLYTLSAVDIASGWWEGEPQMGRSQKATEESFAVLRQQFPFRLREVHPDNDSALLNDLLWKYCRRRQIAMSRSRPYQKNDNAWVEQKNWTHVRKLVGYRRLDRVEELHLLRQLYRAWSEYQNFFQPGMKLVEKVREGGQLYKRYDAPQTPYQRLLQSTALTASRKKSLQKHYASLNPAALHRRIEELKNRLYDLVESKGASEPRLAPRHGPSIELTRARNQRLRALAGD